MTAVGTSLKQGHHRPWLHIAFGQSVNCKFDELKLNHHTCPREQPGEVVTEEEGDNSAFDSQHWGPERTIVLNRQPNQGLGISIVGGKVNPVGSGKESSGKVATENIHKKTRKFSRSNFDRIADI